MWPPPPAASSRRMSSSESTGRQPPGSSMPQVVNTRDARLSSSSRTRMSLTGSPRPTTSPYDGDAGGALSRPSATDEAPMLAPTPAPGAALVVVVVVAVVATASLLLPRAFRAPDGARVTTRGGELRREGAETEHYDRLEVIRFRFGVVETHSLYLFCLMGGFFSQNFLLSRSMGKTVRHTVDGIGARRSCPHHCEIRRANGWGSREDTRDARRRHELCA